MLKKSLIIQNVDLKYFCNQLRNIINNKQGHAYFIVRTLFEELVLDINKSTD